MLLDKDVCGVLFAGIGVVIWDETATGGIRIFKASKAAPPHNSSHRASPNISIPALPALL